MNVPQHVAIIMDGNGRWAQARGHQRAYGHVRGAQVARSIIREAGRCGVQYLTLYTFSTENWNRPATEVGILMRILEKYLRREQATLMQDQVRFRSIGDLSRLPQSARQIILETVELTKNNTGLNLVFALNYGGRQELVSLAQRLAEQVKDGKILAQDISEETISNMLDTSFMPDPDLIIRTSGEQRLSNFLSWQSVYSELYFTPVPWPDFSELEFRIALQSFGARDRRFGRVSGKLSVASLFR